MKHTKKRLLCILLAAAVLWAVFALTRFGPFTTYVPFSGKLFSMGVESADSVFVQNGTTGEQFFFASEAEKKEIGKTLSGLRYRFWFPDIPLAKGGWSFRVAMEAEGRQYSYYFDENTMTVNGIVYVFPEGQLDALRRYVE